MSVVYAGPGMRHTPGDYTHLLTFAYGAALHSYRDAFANKEGSRQRVPFGAMLALRGHACPLHGRESVLCAGPVSPWVLKDTRRLLSGQTFVAPQPICTRT